MLLLERGHKCFLLFPTHVGKAAAVFCTTQIQWDVLKIHHLHNMCITEPREADVVENEHLAVCVCVVRVTLHVHQCFAADVNVFLCSGSGLRLSKTS